MCLDSWFSNHGVTERNRNLTDKLIRRRREKREREERKKRKKKKERRINREIIFSFIVKKLQPKMIRKTLSILLLFCSSGRSEECENEICYPEYGDILIGRQSQLFATSTCGAKGPERSCESKVCRKCVESV